MSKYVIQMYQRYGVWEPAEGGYYYECIAPEQYEIYNTKAKAIEELCKFVAEVNEKLEQNDPEYLRLNSDRTWACIVNNKYIGEGEEFYVEPYDKRGCHKREPQLYC